MQRFLGSRRFSNQHKNVIICVGKHGICDSCTEGITQRLSAATLRITVQQHAYGHIQGVLKNVPNYSTA